jgi:hypothetical protein
MRAARLIGRGRHGRLVVHIITIAIENGRYDDDQGNDKYARADQSFQ